MADVVFPIDDERILNYLRETFGFDEGQANPRIHVEVNAQPPVENSVISHVVDVKLSYGLQLGEISKLAGI